MSYLKIMPNKTHLYNLLKVNLQNKIKDNSIQILKIKYIIMMNK